LILGAVLLVSAMVVPVPLMAQVGISVNIGLPPPVTFVEPPQVIVLPDTDDVYVVPDIDIDLFFWDGWWWRLWDGHWYRSHYYNRGWAHYRSIPRFYYDVDPSWRVYYRDRDWRGHRWHYERIPDRRLERNWNSWRRNGYWHRQRTWGVEGYRPLPPRQRQDLRNWRQEQHRQRPDFQRYQQERERRQPQVQRRPQHHERRYQPQRHEQRHQVQQRQHTRPEGRREREEGERRR